MSKAVKRAYECPACAGEAETAGRCKKCGATLRVRKAGEEAGRDDPLMQLLAAQCVLASTAESLAGKGNAKMAGLFMAASKATDAAMDVYLGGTK